MTVSLDLYHINYLAITTIIFKFVVLEITQRDLSRVILKIHGSDI